MATTTDRSVTLERVIQQQDIMKASLRALVLAAMNVESVCKGSGLAADLEDFDTARWILELCGEMGLRIAEINSGDGKAEGDGDVQLSGK